MKIVIRAYTEKDLPAMVEIWNQVVEDGVAFPQEDALTLDTGRAFFAAQTYDAVAEDADTGTVLGLYILHPNNIGRCGHIANASYAVHREARGLHQHSLTDYCMYLRMLLHYYRSIHHCHCCIPCLLMSLQLS